MQHTNTRYFAVGAGFTLTFLLGITCGLLLVRSLSAEFQRATPPGVLSAKAFHLLDASGTVAAELTSTGMAFCDPFETVRGYQGYMFGKATTALADAPPLEP